jgi:thiol:disulfide interchange protein/DsbC/DsbD-like thiol-disulfide interchange protein
LRIKFHGISHIVLSLFFICMPFLYSEDPSQVNQLHSSGYQFEVDESIPNSSTQPLKVSILAENSNFAADQPFWVALHFKMDDHWHVYWKNPGDSGMPVSVDWELPAGFKADSFEWPYPQHFDADSLIGFGYENEVYLLNRIIPPQHIDKAGDYSFKASIKYLVCSDSACLPGEDEVQLSLPLTAGQPQVNLAEAEAFNKARAALPNTTGVFQAQRLNDLIELGLKAPKPILGSITKAYFFPEKGQSIDYHEKIVVSESNPDGSYSLALKEKDSLSRTNLLKGVLVLTSLNGNKTHTQAFTVNVPVLDRTGDELLVANDAPAGPPVDIKLPLSSDDQYDGGFGMALLLAFVGGMILNLMPCVLPVISFKILSFVKMAGQSRRLTLQHGAAFGAGVMISFWTLAAVLLILQAYGQAVGWGFQLQEPLFVAILAAILLIFSLSLFGVFEMGIKVGSLAGQLQHQGAREGLTASFLSGVLATLIATPCTGPFLGTAVGFAMTLPYYLSLLIFTSLGLGMAFPYLLLSAYPSLMRFLPKPGAWMETFKQLMGFLMLASVLWLVWVFAAQTGSMNVVILLSAFFIMSLACWIYGRWGTPIHSKVSRLISLTCVSMLLAMGFYALTFAIDDSSTAPSQNKEHVAAAESVWEEFSPKRLAELQAKGIPVFVDFTAKWCLICQANHMILTSSAVHAKFDKLGVVRMKADWTKKDAVITEELRKFGRNSVPLYVLYNGEDAKPAILPQVLTPGVVLDHLKVVE